MPRELVNQWAPLGVPIIGLAVSKRRSVVVSDFAAAIEQAIVESVDEQLDDRGTYLEVTRPGPGSAGAVTERREHNLRVAAVYRTIAAGRCWLGTKHTAR